MIRWKTLEHNGIHIPDPYESKKGVGIKIKGVPISLSLLQEEMVYQWAKKKDTSYAQDKVFQKNFTNDLVQEIRSRPKTETDKDIIKQSITYQDIDFTDAYDVVEKEKQEKQGIETLPPEERKQVKKALAAKRKEIREKLKAEYGTAIVDGQPVDIANYVAEPPGIFIGRGEHPLRGRWKKQITKSDITLNLGKEAKVPDGDWKEIVHNQEATWLASWTDFLTKKTKYVWLADTAGLRQERDKEKYEKAKKLEKEIEKIKDTLVKDMSGGPKTKIATVCYLIYRTAMRVGDEKDPEEADTVGATTLRKEHITITDDTIEFDFLGKDSIRWQETISVQGHDRQFQKNLEKLIKTKKSKKDKQTQKNKKTKKGKNSDKEIFDGITSRHVNAYYSGIVPGLTAKVFRTYLATNVVKEYLVKHDDIHNKTDTEKLYHAKLANLEAAVMCNHKRTIPKNFDEKLQERYCNLKEIRKQKPWDKAERDLEETKDKKPWDKAEKELEKIKKINPKTDKQKKNKSKRLRAKRKQIKKQKEYNKNKIDKLVLQIKKHKERHKNRVEKLSLQLDLAKKTRDYSLGTSLRNYIDPRVFKAWTDEIGAEWERLYTAALQKKFLWVKNEQIEWRDIKS